MSFPSSSSLTTTCSADDEVMLILVLIDVEGDRWRHRRHQQAAAVSPAWTMLASPEMTQNVRSWRCLKRSSQPSLASKVVTPIFSASCLDLAFTIPPDKGLLIARASFIQRTNAASRLGNKHWRIFFLLFEWHTNRVMCWVKKFASHTNSATHWVTSCQSESHISKCQIHNFTPLIKVWSRNPPGELTIFGIKMVK